MTGDVSSSKVITEDEVVFIPSNGQNRIAFGSGQDTDDFALPRLSSDRVASLFLPTGSAQRPVINSGGRNKAGLKKEPSLFFQRVDIGKPSNLHNTVLDSIALDRSSIASKKEKSGGHDGIKQGRGWCSVSDAIRVCFVVTLVGVMIYLLVIFVDFGPSKEVDLNGYPVSSTRPPPPPMSSKESAGAAPTESTPSPSPVLTASSSPTAAAEPPTESLVTEDKIDATETSVTEGKIEEENDSMESLVVTGDKSDPSNNKVVSDRQPPALIGFVEAPLDPAELVLLVETNKDFNVESGSNSLDMSKLTATTTETGDTIYCHATVDGIPVFVECIADEPLCRVYVGNSSSDKCMAQLS